MSSIEERLARDIAVVVKGVVVTESDLREARKAIDERVENRRQRDRRLALALTGAAAVVITVVAVAAIKVIGGDQSAPPVSPAPSNAEPSFADGDEAFLTGDVATPEDLAGVWRVDNGRTLLRFSSSGEFSYTDEGQLFGGPAGQGTYTMTGGLISIDLEAEVAGCEGRTFDMRATVPEPGLMRVAHTLPGFGGCTIEPSHWWTLEHVLPTGPSVAGFIPSSEPEAEWRPLKGQSSLYGDWFAEGGGHVLELTPTGSYYVADESGEPVDDGQWSLEGAALRLTSSAHSTECSEGDVLLLTGMESYVPDTVVIRGTLEQNACGGAWASATWVLLPDSNHE